MVKWHGSTYTIFCDTCTKGFMTNRALSAHKPRSGQVKVKKQKIPISHSCLICTKSFNRKCNLERHINTHSDHKEYTCDQCGKQFREYRGIRNHKIKIHGEDNWEIGILPIDTICDDQNM